MTKQERLYGIHRQLDLLGYRADRLNPDPGFLTPNSTSRTFSVRLVPPQHAAKKKLGQFVTMW